MGGMELGSSIIKVLKRLLSFGHRYDALTYLRLNNPGPQYPTSHDVSPTLKAVVQCSMSLILVVIIVVTLYRHHLFRVTMHTRFFVHHSFFHPILSLSTLAFPETHHSVTGQSVICKLSSYQF